MSGIFQVFLSVISGTFIGALCFSLWLSGLMFIYVSLYGYYNLGPFIFGDLILDKPVFLAFIIGLIFGIIQGFLTGVFSKIYEINTLSKEILIGFVVTQIIVLGIYFLLSVFDHPNPIELILGFIQDDLFRLLKISLILFIPSAATGLILAKIVSFFASR